MSDDLKNRCPADPSRINVRERRELEWWTKSLNTNEHDLRNAITVVGPSADTVRRYLGK